MIDHGPLMLPYRRLGKFNRPLKIGLVLSGSNGPAWIRSVVQYLKSIPEFEVHSIVTAGTRTAEPIAPSWLADRLYAASRRKYDPFAEAALDVDPAPPSGMDMLVWLQGEAVPKGPVTELAQLGVFTLQLSDNQTYPPYWREVILREPTSTTILFWHDATFERGRAVRIAETGTCRDWAFTRNAEAPLTAVARLVAGVGLELLADAEGWRRRASECPEVELGRRTRRAYPSFVDTSRFLASQTAHSIEVRLKGRNGRRPRWFIGIRRQPSLFYSSLGRFSPSAIEEIPLAPMHMADPFVVSEQRTDWLFYEEIPMGSSRGRLMCAEIGAPGSPASKPEIILKKDHHLSYPCVFPHKGEFLLMPESCEDRTIPLYRATRFPFEFQFETNLIENLSAVDTTPFFLDGKWYFFTTTTEPFMESFLFWADSLDGRWNLHPASPISSSVKNVRAAGHLFYHGGRLLRPTQDCSVRYGYGITINEVFRLTPTEFEERQVDFIAPAWRPGLLGTHTLNSNSTIEVVDGIRYQ
jgi:hypothetical protein